MVRLALVIAVLFSLFSSITPVAAQDTVTTGPKLGEPANIYDNNGEPVGTVTVTEIVDPYANFDVINSPPARGFHWIVATMSFTAGAGALPINTSGFLLIDTAGFTSYAGYYYQNSTESEQYPPFSVSEIAAGESLSGSVYFQVFNDEKPAIIEYSPSYEQVVVALDLRDQIATPGEPVVWTTTDGSTIGEISVAGVIDPFEDFDNSYPPQRGFRYVAVAIHFSNTGTRPVTLSSYAFSATDHEGFVVQASGIYRTTESTASIPDLPYDPIQPGGEATGLVTFLMINGATLNDVIFVPSSDRRVRLAEFARDAEFTAPEVIPVATVAVDPACEGVVAWGTAVTDALVPVAGAFELVTGLGEANSTVTPDQLRDSAAAFDDTLAALDAVETPEIAQAAHDQIEGIMQAIADLVDKTADDLEAADTAAVTADVDALYQQAFSLTGGAYGELVVRCPALDDL